MIHDARLAIRIALDCAASITVLDETRLAGRLRNLSCGGACVLTTQRLRLAQLCALRFEVARDGGPQSVLAMGQIVYSDGEPDGTFRTGIRFIDVAPDSVAAIGALLRAGVADAP